MPIRPVRRRMAVLVGLLVLVGLVVGWSRRGESFEERAERARAETEGELRALAAGLGLEVREFSSMRAREEAADFEFTRESFAQASDGGVRLVLVRSGGVAGSEQARLVLEGLAEAGYSLVAEDCSSWGFGGVFENADGESLQVGVQKTGEVVNLTATIGLDHERLEVSEVPFLDGYRSRDCWPSL